MAWPSGRRRPYNPQWPITVRHVRQRSGGLCEVLDDLGERCSWPMAEVDHVMPWSLGGSDLPTNARAICRAHHNAKTQSEAQEAARLKRERGRRPEEVHPWDLME